MSPVLSPPADHTADICPKPRGGCGSRITGECVVCGVVLHLWTVPYVEVDEMREQRWRCPACRLEVAR